MSSGGWAVTLSSFSVSPGSIVYDGSMPRPAYLVKVSSSTIVMTVSRCMNARFCGMRQRHDLAGAAGREQPAGEPLDALGRGPLAHPDQYGAAAEDEDVAALGGGHAAAEPSDQTWKSASANSGCQR